MNFINEKYRSLSIKLLLILSLGRTSRAQRCKLLCRKFNLGIPEIIESIISSLVKNYTSIGVNIDFAVSAGRAAFTNGFDQIYTR